MEAALDAAVMLEISASVQSKDVAAT